MIFCVSASIFHSSIWFWSEDYLACNVFNNYPFFLQITHETCFQWSSNLSSLELKTENARRLVVITLTVKLRCFLHASLSHWIFPSPFGFHSCSCQRSLVAMAAKFSNQYYQSLQGKFSTNVLVLIRMFTSASSDALKLKCYTLDKLCSMQNTDHFYVLEEESSRAIFTLSSLHI